MARNILGLKNLRYQKSTLINYHAQAKQERGAPEPKYLGSSEFYILS